MFPGLGSYALNRFFVFEGHQGLQSRVALPFIYLAQCLLGSVLIWFCVEKIGVSDVEAPLVVIMVSVPFTYFFAHLAFFGKTKNKSSSLVVSNRDSRPCPLPFIFG